MICYKEKKEARGCSMLLSKCAGLTITAEAWLCYYRS